MSVEECPDSCRTLGIIHEFRKLYEDKMKIIEAEGAGDCNLQAKLSLQQDWIRDLNEQNEMLVRAVEELEQEATERVIALEEKLRQSSKCACEMKQDLIHKDKNLKILQQKLDDAIMCKQLMVSEMQKECTKCNEIRKSMFDIRDALTAEVADKHDVVLTLKRDVQVLEEQCKKADQQTHFKDDIIKELRKEIKQMKAEILLMTHSTKYPKSLSNLSSPDSYKTATLPSITNDDRRFLCPVREHINIERYKDFRNRVVIFVCEDTTQTEIFQTFDGQNLHVDYHNRRVVHEFETDKLKDMYHDQFELSSTLLSIPSLEDDELYKLKMITPRDEIAHPKYSSSLSELVHSHPQIKKRKQLTSVTHVVDNLGGNIRKRYAKKPKSAVLDARSFLFCKEH